MTELTPERIHDAAEVVELLYGNTNIPATGNNLHAAAEKLQREQAAAKAKREKRIEQLAAELHAIAGGSIPFDCIGTTLRDWYLPVARRLLDRYPALAEATDCGHPRHGDDNHSCASVLSYRVRNAQ